MSARWTLFKDLLRPHIVDRLDVHHYSNVVELLRKMVHFQQTTPLQACSALPAALDIYLLQGNEASRQQPTVTAKVPLKLWSAVLPWEVMRGLSGTPPTTLLPQSLVSYAESTWKHRNAAAPSESEKPPCYPSIEDLCTAGEMGMLFIKEEVNASAATCYWSGAITCPIDIAFIQRVDAFSDMRRTLAPVLQKEKTKLPPPDNFRHDSLRAAGLDLVMVDQNKLEPFSRNDAVFGTPLMTLYADLYSKSAPGASPADAVRVTEAKSRETSIAAVLETRRRFYFDHVSAALSKVPKHQSATAGVSAVVLLNVSEELNNEIEEKRQLLKTLVPTLEKAVCDIVRLAFVASHPTERPAPEENESDACDRHDAGQRSDWGSHRSRDEGALLPHPSANSKSFTGKLNSTTDAKTFSAGHSSRYPDTDPRQPLKPKLPYEVLVLSYQLGLCLEEIASLGARMIQELDEGLVEASDLQHLTKLDDPSLSVADELLGAIRAALARSRS